MNRWNIAGYTGDTDFQMSKNGTPICKFSVGVQGWSSQSGKKTDWIQVVAFKDLAERMEKFIKSGSFVCVSGRAEISRWKNSEGVMVTSISLIADDFTLGPKTEKQAAREKKPDPMEETVEELVRTAVTQLDEFDPSLE